MKDIMKKLSKKQRVALKQIDELSGKRNKQLILGFASIGVMAVLIFSYNLLTYQLGFVDETNTIFRAVLYITAMVIAGFCGIMLMRASRNKGKIDQLRQATGISRDTLEAWKRGEYDE